MTQKPSASRIALPIIAIAALLPLGELLAKSFNFKKGNAAVEVVIPTVAPVIFRDVSQTGGDATLVLRLTALMTNSWFDATAPYHPTAVGVYTHLGRQNSPKNNEPLNIALLYASYRVLNSLLPQQGPLWRKMLDDVKLDPDDNSTDPSTPVGLGNLAGAGVVAGRERDGMNQIGDEDGRIYNFVPYQDYTGYTPVNTAHELADPSRWQPDLQRQGMGLYKVQQSVTPQYAYVEPYSFNDDPAAFPLEHYVPPPTNSDIVASPGDYQDQADEVLLASASLTEEQKLKAELFDNKIESLGFSAVFAAQSQGLSLLEFIQLDFLTNMAAFDAGIVVWYWKNQYDAVRPFSAIGHIYGDNPVTAWGGPGQGTVADLPASHWKSYLEEADHPEYPSASSCFCRAHAQSARRFLPAGDALGFPVARSAGSSRIEPGVVPASDRVLVFPTWTDFAEDCGNSRIWAGVHFPAAVQASFNLCDKFGDKAYEYLGQLLDGTAALRPPSVGRF